MLAALSLLQTLVFESFYDVIATPLTGIDTLCLCDMGCHIKTSVLAYKPHTKKPRRRVKSSAH